MVATYILLILLVLLKYNDCIDLNHIQILSYNVSEKIDPKKYENLKEVCKHRDFLCKTNSSKICAMTFINKTNQFKPFKNTCYLFLANLCDYDGQEYHIVESGSCSHLYEDFRKFLNRRTNTTFANTTEVLLRTESGNATTENSRTSNNTAKLHMVVTNKPSGKTTTKWKPKYEIEEAFDSHKCPYTCPHLYSPVCMSVNRGEGKYFKFFTFVNHCLADIYYCKNFKDLGPPPTREYEDIQVSPLGWSFCGAYRYLQFARYSEVVSSMGHYGWLAGDYRYSHIMEPHQKLAGYG